MTNFVDLPILKDFEKTLPPLEWVKKNCPSYITNTVVQKHDENYYRYYFYNDRDRMMFALKWT